MSHFQQSNCETSKPIILNEFAPPFWIVKNTYGQLFAVFEDMDDAYIFDVTYPELFKDRELTDEYGVSFYLGYLQ
jgi:hypothetical protein